MNLDDLYERLEETNNESTGISECTKKILTALIEYDLVEENTCELIDE